MSTLRRTLRVLVVGPYVLILAVGTLRFISSCQSIQLLTSSGVREIPPMKPRSTGMYSSVWIGFAAVFPVNSPQLPGTSRMRRRHSASILFLWISVCRFVILSICSCSMSCSPCIPCCHSSFCVSLRSSVADNFASKCPRPAMRRHSRSAIAMQCRCVPVALFMPFRAAAVTMSSLRSNTCSLLRCGSLLPIRCLQWLSPVLSSILNDIRSLVARHSSLPSPTSRSPLSILRSSSSADSRQRSSTKGLIAFAF